MASRSESALTVHVLERGVRECASKEEVQRRRHSESDQDGSDLAHQGRVILDRLLERAQQRLLVGGGRVLAVLPTRDGDGVDVEQVPHLDLLQPKHFAHFADFAGSHDHSVALRTGFSVD